MSTIKYRNINLEIVNTREVSRRAIMSSDGTTYLYDHWTFDFHVRYSPAATSYRRGATPIQMAGLYPFETDDALKHYLSQPRGVLEVNMGNGPLIRSPNLGSVTDAKNGPVVETCNIIEVLGERQWLVHFRIHTWVNRCTKSSTGGSLNPLISHRWRRYVDIDQDHFSTIVTEGEATFRTDLLLAAGTYPDAYRRDLFHPIPPNCQRGPIHVEAMSDGTGIRYHFADIEKPFNFGSHCPATRIEAYMTAWHNHISPIDNVMDQTGNFIEGFANVFTTNPGQGVGQMARAAGRMIRLPKFNLRCFCRAWGNRNSSRTALTSLAMGLCLGRVGPLANRTTQMILTHDLNGKFVEFDVTVSWGMETAVVNDIIFQPLQGIADLVMPEAGAAIEAVGGTIPSTWDALVDTFPNDNSTINASGLILTNRHAIGNPRPPDSKGTRGTWLGQLVHQALSGSCEIPPQPPLYVKSRDLTLY